MESHFQNTHFNVNNEAHSKRELSAQARGRLFSNFIHKKAFLRHAFAVTEFFASSLEFWIFGKENINTILYFSFTTLYPSLIRLFVTGNLQ